MAIIAPSEIIREEPVPPANSVFETRVLAGAILRHGKLENFPVALKSIVEFDARKRTYRIVETRETAAKLHAYARYTDHRDCLVAEPDLSLHQFWVARRWYKYDPDTHTLRLSYGNWAKKATRIRAIKTLVKVVCKEGDKDGKKKDYHEITARDFAEHGIGNLLAVYFDSSPSQALAAAGFRIDKEKLAKKPQGHYKDMPKVPAGFKRWAKKSGFVVEYEMPDGSTQKVIELPRKLSLVAGGVKWAQAFARQGGMATLPKRVGMPVLYRIGHTAEGTLFYLEHEGAFRHYARQFLEENKYLKEYETASGDKEEIVVLPKVLDALGGDASKLYSALKDYHGGINDLQRLIGTPVYTSTKSASKGGLPHYLDNPTLLRAFALDVLSRNEMVETENGKPVAINLPKSIGTLSHNHKERLAFASLYHALSIKHVQKKPVGTRENPQEALQRVTGLPVRMLNAA